MKVLPPFVKLPSFLVNVTIMSFILYDDEPFVFLKQLCRNAKQFAASHRDNILAFLASPPQLIDRSFTHMSNRQ